ncbi:MAG: class I SAM-dependent methyltransferase [Burkholderiales bacterium]|jgi:caffeoyl-CoA O-methyltransferase|nr:class I SAM-dependent methyltransferase [Burkholderiales bacterium]
MAGKWQIIPDAIRGYVLAHSVRDTALLAELREVTAKEPMGRMQVSPDEGQFLAFLVQAIDAKRCIEVGTFTGYSALCMALALPPDGRLTCIDRSEEWTAVARGFWERAGVATKIDLALGPALPILDGMLEDGLAATFDFAFIDADKENHAHYYERCLRLVRSGGVVAIDNTLWSGAVADPADQEASTNAIRALNDFLHRDERVSIAMLTIADGLTLAVKR